MTPIHIGLLAFPAMTQLDMTGPLQVFSALPGATVHVIWKTQEPIQTQGGPAADPRHDDSRMSQAGRDLRARRSRRAGPDG